MTRAEYERYWAPARFAVVRDSGQKIKPASFTASKMLATHLGFTYLDPGNWDKIPLTEQLKNQLEALAGPHCATMLKVIKIRKENAET